MFDEMGAWSTVTPTPLPSRCILDPFVVHLLGGLGTSFVDEPVGLVPQPKVGAVLGHVWVQHLW